MNLVATDSESLLMMIRGIQGEPEGDKAEEEGERQSSSGEWSGLTDKQVYRKGKEIKEAGCRDVRRQLKFLSIVCLSL